MTHAAVVEPCSTRVQQRNEKAIRINTYILLDAKTKKRRTPKRYSTHKCGNTQQRQNEGKPQPIEAEENTQPESQRQPQHTQQKDNKNTGKE